MFPVRRRLVSPSKPEFPQKMTRNHRLAGGAEEVISRLQPRLSPVSVGLCDPLSTAWQCLTPVVGVWDVSAFEGGPRYARSVCDVKTRVFSLSTTGCVGRALRV